MSLNWINPEDYNFNNFLLMERFQIHRMMKSGGWYNKKAEWKYSMGVALNANPVVRWFFEHKCPECSAIINEITANVPILTDAEEIRKAEVYALSSVEDFVVYTHPEIMNTNCDFIRGWDKERLYEMADFDGKMVLDVGSGSGRLSFAAAELAKEVYASEPVGTLREYMRKIISEKGIKNVRVLDGMADALPYPDNTFDIVMSGHVIGEDYKAEIAELTRVCKSGGWLLDCPGDSIGNIKLNENNVNYGFESMYYKGSFGKDVYRYRKQIIK